MTKIQLFQTLSQTSQKLNPLPWDTSQEREPAQLTGDVHPERGGDGEAHVVVDCLADEDGVEVGVAHGGDTQRVDRRAVEDLEGVVDEGVLAPPRQARRRVPCVGGLERVRVMCDYIFEESRHNLS